MRSRMYEMRRKEVINIRDGTRLGNVCDIEIDTVTASVLSLVIYGKLRFFGLFGREDDRVIPWSDIRIIGEDIVLVDFEQQVVEGEYQPSVETPLHLKIYKKRPEAMAVVHVHSPFATAFAVARKNIPVILEETAQAVGHEIGVAAYAHCGTPQLADNVVKALGATRQAVLLANHGLVAVGETMDQALKICYVVEKTARVAIYARSLGPAHSLSQEDINFLRSSFEHYGQAHK